MQRQTLCHLQVSHDDDDDDDLDFGDDADDDDDVSLEESLFLPLLSVFTLCSFFCLPSVFLLLS